MKVCASHQNPWRGPRRIAPASLWTSLARSVGRLEAVILCACLRSFCASLMTVFRTSSGLKSLRVLQMCALTCWNWTTPLSVIAATRSCGKATRPQSGACWATYSVWEISCQRSLASGMVLCQEHSLSANLRDVHLPRVIQSTERTHAGIVRMTEVAGFHWWAAIPLWKIWLRGPVRRTILGPTAVSSRANCMRASTWALAAQSRRIVMGTLPRSVLLVCTGREFDGLEGVVSLAVVLVSGIMAAQKAPMVWLKLAHV